MKINKDILSLNKEKDRVNIKFGSGHFVWNPKEKTLEDM
jgi:hypothetical protein